MKTGVIVQARVNSQRLPKKIFADICGKTMLERVLERAGKVKANVHILAVPYDQIDWFIQVPKKWKLMAPPVEENDVLARFYAAASAVKLDAILRITADCPLIEPEVCQQVLDALRENGVEYASNVMPRTFPKGLDCEAFTFEALHKAHEEAKDEYEREHVTPWMQANCLVTTNIENPDNPRHLAIISDDNWSVDTNEDLEKARAIFHRMQYIEKTSKKSGPFQMRASGFKSE